MIPASCVNGALCTARHSRAAQRRRRHAERKPRFVASAETAANYNILSMSLNGRQLGRRTSERTNGRANERASEQASECWDGCDRLLLQVEQTKPGRKNVDNCSSHKLTGSGLQAINIALCCHTISFKEDRIPPPIG